jgi:hypothetical protein
MVQLAGALATTLAQAPSASSCPTSIVAPPIAPHFEKMFAECSQKMHEKAKKKLRIVQE